MNVVKTELEMSLCESKPKKLTRSFTMKGTKKWALTEEMWLKGGISSDIPPLREKYRIYIIVIS